ncbi:heme-binding protein [Rhodoferax sp.]|uniref:GlcG/HbpS family heme-binding protein n=1 Tax=Rhodoferax sp. TaxID=50421 RepID=UPI0025ED5A84|nr:heme-binding protein [Rhodoferax sp.]
MLTSENALRALQLTVAEQAIKEQPVSIAISDSHGELLAFVRMDGASLHSGVVAQNKAYTAARDRQATADLGAWSRSSGRSMGYWSDPRFTGFGGGLPLRANGEVVGAVGVSALSEDEDVLVAQALIARWLP